jgi:hypothetical protein
MNAVLNSLDGEFLRLDARSREFLGLVDDARLFERPRETTNSMAPFSCGEFILRSAAMVEQTFGGITTRLWDDPFEWTLPEKLADRSKILYYLDEVEETRRNGFSFLTSDADLQKRIPAPEKLRPILDIFLDTMLKAAHYQGRAFAVFQIISDEKLPRL